MNWKFLFIYIAVLFCAEVNSSRNRMAESLYYIMDLNFLGALRLFNLVANSFPMSSNKITVLLTD